MIFELDEDAGEIDEMLLLRLVSVFFRRGKVYVLRDSLKEVSEEKISAVPTRSAVLERLIGGE